MGVSPLASTRCLNRRSPSSTSLSMLRLSRNAVQLMLFGSELSLNGSGQIAKADSQERQAEIVHSLLDDLIEYGLRDVVQVPNKGHVGAPASHGLEGAPGMDT